MFDFSNYPKDSKPFDLTNKTFIGKLKDKFEGKIVDVSLALKSEMYSIKNIDSKELNTAKGVNIATEFKELKDTLFNKTMIRHRMKRIQSKKHRTGTYKISKISLSCFDDKIFVLNDGIHTLAYIRNDIDSHG